MGDKVMRWLLSSTGYMLYTLVVLVFLLWLLFPEDAVRDWLQRQLDGKSPHYSWKVGSVRFALPAGLVMTNMRMTPVQGKESLLTLDRLVITPEVTHLFRQDKTMNYTLHLLQGAVRGQILLRSDSKQFTGQGILDGLQLAQMDVLQQALGRTFAATVGGKFSSQGTWDSPLQAKLQGNLRLTGGYVQFREPVLGLDELPYTKIETNFSGHKGQWMFEQGKLQSTQMDGTFSGSLQAGKTLAAGRLQFKGALTPRSEMFAGLKNKQMVEVVRTHLKDGGLPFTVSGTAGEPGILFGGELSQALKSLKGSAK